MKKIYYEKYKFMDKYELYTEMFCGDDLVDVLNVKKIKIVFPSGESEEFVDFEPIDRYIHDRDGYGYRDMNFEFNFNYKGIIFKLTARELIERGCDIFIEV